MSAQLPLKSTTAGNQPKTPIDTYYSKYDLLVDSISFRRGTLISILFLLLILMMLLAVGRGAYPVSPLQALEAFTTLPLQSGLTDQQAAVLWSIRLPRVLLGALLGAGLAVSGALLQGLFRNPLADPGLIGVTGGAALAAAMVIVLGATLLPGFSRMLGLFTLPLFAVAGGFAIAAIIYRIATREGYTSMPVMLLAGIAVNALVVAGIGLLTYIATDEQLRTLTFWSLGSLAPANWPVVMLTAPFVLLSMLAAMHALPALNAVLLGEQEASHLGVNVQRLKAIVTLLATISVGVCTAFCGMVGFIGLIAPHCVRLIAGPDHRVVVPASALLGASLVLLADLVARTAFAPAELPLGVLTALLGAPFFLMLLLSQRRHWGV
jgi:iron complex transport system permease protein